MTDNIIEVLKLKKSFDKHVVFERCSVTIEKGTVFGLVGLNGSGKTTFIRMLLGLLKPQEGAIRVMGTDPWQHKSSYYRQLGVILDNDGFAGNMNIAENLRIFSQAKGMAWTQVEEYIDGYWQNTFIHKEIRGGKKKVKYLSRGQKMQCGICRAFLSWPQVYFLDEPTVALDVDAIDHFYSLVKHASSRGGTVLISSHQLSAIEELCDAVGMLDNNNITILKSGTEASLPKSWFVRCAPNDKFGRAIEDICGFPSVYFDGAWHFPVVRPEHVVPKIVSALASLGCEIIEVRPEIDNLKDRIRTHFRDTKG
jgi:ABC-2 type transport system ATP-binding protein